MEKDSISFILHCLAWLAMCGSIFKAAAYPLVSKIEGLTGRKERKFMHRWTRVALEAIIITLLSLRVLGHI